MGAAPHLRMIKSTQGRPQSAHSSAADDIEEFELPPELAWLSQAASYSGGGAALAEEPELEIPTLDCGFGAASRVSTPDSALVAPVAQPKSRPNFLRPQHGTTRSKGVRSKPWLWKAKDSPRHR